MEEEIDLDKQAAEYYIQALLLAEVIKRILRKQGEIRLSNKPQITLKPITEFHKRMRVSGLEKFDEKTFISTVNYYVSKRALESHKSLGAVSIYIPEIYIVKLMQDLQYPVIDIDDEEGLEDACGTFCNLIAGNFKTGLMQLDYQELIMSHFSTFRNEIPDGVEIHPDQDELYEISFEIRGEKKIVADLAVGPLPKVDPQAWRYE